MQSLQVFVRHLEMREGSRISAQSLYERSFRKGEGFAGKVWEERKAMIEGLVNDEHDFRFQGKYKPNHEFKSIMGLPITVGNDVLGVLCIQSEQENAFSQEDLRAVTFYANCCSLIFLYDKILLDGSDVDV